MRAIQLPNRNLLIPVESDDPDAGASLREIGADHPDYSRWLALAEPGEDPRPGKGGPVKRFLQGLDRTLEKMVTDLYGPPAPGQGRPGLGVKLAVFALFAALLALGLAATR
jgi:hypothetical protein